MSMSSLGNQLSALASSSKNAKAGFATSSSRTNNEAIGRGFHHSNKHGHAIITGDDSGSRRASILYDNARDAADVGTAELRENAIAALEVIGNALQEEFAAGSGAASMWTVPEFVGSGEGLLSEQMLNGYERGTSTSSRNAEVDASIEKLLNLIMTVVAECPPTSGNEGEGSDNNLDSNPVLLSCLHVVEYLLRHYTVHSRPYTASALLRAFLPLQISHPASYPRIFSRILSLVDLGSMPEWSFLRPYAAKGSPPLNRGTLAKRVARDDALVREVTDTGRRGMEACVEEGRLAREREMKIDSYDDGDSGDDDDASSRALPVRRGISVLISFSASVLAEALHVQSSSKDSGVGGGVKESTVRVLLPSILSACRSGGIGGKNKGEKGHHYCPEWKEWGRLMASTLASLCPLNDDVGTAFCDAVAEGLLLPGSRSGIVRSGLLGGGKEEETTAFREAAGAIVAGSAGAGAAATLRGGEADDARSAVMTLLSVLGAVGGNGDGASNDDDDDAGWEHYLPILPPAGGRGGDGCVVDYLGCELPPSTYARLTSDEWWRAPLAMGAVLGSHRAKEEEEDGGGDDDGGGNGGYAMIAERMAPLAVSVVMHAFRKLEGEAAVVLSSSPEPSHRKKKKRKSRGGGVEEDDDAAGKFGADRDVLLILAMIKEPSLSRLWTSKNSALVAALTVHTLLSYDRAYHSLSSPAAAVQRGRSAAIVVERYEYIMKALASVAPAVHDRGVAYAINAIAEDSSPSEGGGNDGDRRMARLARLLGRDDASPPATPGKGGAAARSENDAAVDGVARLLPACVALEHADAKVRLDAVARLEAGMENCDEATGAKDDDLGRALLRRLVADDDPKVAAAAGRAIVGQLKLSQEDGDGDETMGSSGMFASLVDTDLEALAEQALASLAKWTYIGKDGDPWSPATMAPVITKGKGKKKKGGKKSKSEGGASSPLLQCIGICGIIAKLLSERVSIENMNVGEDDDLDSLERLFCALFLSLGAHITGSGSQASQGNSSPLVNEASEAAAVELMRLSNNDGACSSVTDLITAHLVGQKVLTHFFGTQREATLGSPSRSLQTRFLWLALHSCSEMLAVASKSSKPSGASFAILQVASNLALYQMGSYNKGSEKSSTFRWEAHFLGAISKTRFSMLAANGGAMLEDAIMELVATQSLVSFNEVAKPAITSYLASDTPQGTAASGLDVLLRACLQPHSSKEGTMRVLEIAQNLFRGEGTESPATRDCMVLALGLLARPEREVRERVIGILEQLESSSSDSVVAEISGKVTDKSSLLRSSLLMDGANALPQLMSLIESSASPATPLQKFLIEGCQSSALNANGTFSKGGCQAAAVLLSAMEKAGENAFPLLNRWNFGGRGLFQGFLNYNQSEELSSLCRLRDCVLSMLKGVVVNEAQAGDGGLNIQLSIGPSQSGRRMRSYSIGTSGDFTSLAPYPESMLEAITKALSSNTPLLLSKHVIQLVLASQSWGNGVFPKLSGKPRNTLTSALLSLRTRNNDELAGSALLGLSLKSSDFNHLLNQVDESWSELDQGAVVFITDCLRGKIDALGTANVAKISSTLFGQLLSLSSALNSSASKGDSGGRDYTRVSLLQSLLSIHSHYKSQLSQSQEKDKHATPKRKRSRSHSDVGSPKALASQADLLVGLLGGNPAVINPLNSGRGRALSLSLLTCLCEESPSTIVTSLLPALMGLAVSSQNSRGDQRQVDMKAVGDALVAIVPAYCAHAETANLSLFNLIESFVGKIIMPNDENKRARNKLLDHLVDALKLLPTKESSSDAIASLAACAMAMQAFNLQKPIPKTDADSETPEVDHDSQARLDLRVFANTTKGVKISVSLSLLKYTGRLMSYICGLSPLSEEESPSCAMRVATSEVAMLALCGDSAGEDATPADYSKLTESKRRSILYLVINLLQSVRDELLTSSARKVVRKSKGSDADLCLRLWNELMQTHTNALRARAELANGEHATLSPLEKRFWDAALVATSECLDNLQYLLPVPHFLASVSSALVDDSADTYIRKKMMKLLSYRVADVDLDSPEASLFLEMVPDLVAQVGANKQPMSVDGEDTSASLRHSIVMQQGALIAIESFVRCLYPSTENRKFAANAAAVFLPALASTTRLLDDTASSWIKTNKNGGGKASLGLLDAECQLLSSTSLCISTLVTTLKARCLPQLPSIIKPLVTSLKSVNNMLGASDDPPASTGELLQLSILKTLQAIAETLPQFLPPYLPLLLSNDALPSKALRRGNNGGDQTVKAALIQVENSLARKVPIRQLMPTLSQALTKTLRTDDNANWEEACSIISIMNSAVESSERSDLSPIIGKIFNGLVMAYGYEGDDNSRPSILQNSNRCLLSLVMKLSENQLRSIYARLREWRGDVEEESEGPVSSIRRYAFWSLSAELSKSLRSIFLPCMTSVLTDVVDELELAVSLLCQRSKKTDGSKRRRVEDYHDSMKDIDKVKPLQPLLLCLESVLKADAHEGGDWTRGDDNQRYKMILNHLGKLLLAQVPKDCPLLSHLTPKEQVSTGAYQQLVQGVGTVGHGNVVGCLTALAAAAGNEQLWKPLNFAVLEACGHKRSEVRKAGITCLLSLIETIGEEYMVLLPECLPVLSELLEDDEEIAGMAKECVRQGEELLGESLEDSLR